MGLIYIVVGTEIGGGTLTVDAFLNEHEAIYNLCRIADAEMENRNVATNLDKEKRQLLVTTNDSFPQLLKVYQVYTNVLD